MAIDILMFIIAYLLGSIPSGALISKYFYHKDLHKEGSGNTGTTNTFRVLGTKAGIVVLLLDLLKGTLATLQPIIFHVTTINPLLIGLGAIIGHTFSIFDRFRGGKAVATSAGLLLAYNPSFFTVACIIFITLMFLSSMVSVASMGAAVLLVIISFFYHDILLTIVAVGLTLFIIYRHRANISRILNGDENLIPFGLVYWRKKKSSK